MSASNRIIIGTVLGGVLGFYVAEQLASGYRVRAHFLAPARRARAARRAGVLLQLSSCVSRVSRHVLRFVRWQAQGGLFLSLRRHLKRSRCACAGEGARAGASLRGARARACRSRARRTGAGQMSGHASASASPAAATGDALQTTACGATYGVAMRSPCAVGAREVTFDVWYVPHARLRRAVACQAV